MSTKSDGQVVIEIVADDKNAEEVLQSFQKSAEDTGRAAEESAKKIDKTSESLGETASASKSASEGIEKVGKQSKDAEKEVEGLGNASKETQSTMVALSASCAALCAGLVAIGAQAVQSSMEFESAFAKTQTIMDTNVMSVSQMREEIMALSKESGMSATDVSGAVYEALSASVLTEDAAAFVAQANKLAVSGFTGLANATDVLTTVLNAYGLEADAVAGISNVLVQTQNLGKATVDELAHSMGKAISTGSAYGVNLENLSTAYVQLTNVGIDTAWATTYISSMLNELGDSGSKVGKLLQEQTGKSFGQLMADGASLADVLKILSDTVDGDAEALMGLWSSQEAGKASNAILSQSIEGFNAVLKQMNAEMSGATGTTDKAYETMTHTSEFIDQKFRNSVNNLGIALGDNLSPAVDWVKSSLTLVTETLTGWVQEYPAISAVTAALTVGIGALGLALGAYTLKAKLAESQTKKLTVAMMKNPFVLVATGLTAAVVGIGAYIAKSSEASEAVAELTQASTALNDTVKDTEEAYKSSMDSIEGNVSLARQYADRLKELEGKEKLTAEQQEEYNSLLEKMKVVMPDINMELDEQTGMLLDGADALQKQIDGWYELAVAQALQEKYTAQIQAQAEAEAELATNIAARKRLESEKAIAEERYNAASESFDKAEKERNRYWDLYSQETERRDAGEGTMSDAEYEGLAQKSYDAADAMKTYGEKVYEYGSFLDGVDPKIEEYNEAIAKNEKTIADNAAAVQLAEDAYRGYVDGLETASEETENTALGMEEMGDVSAGLVESLEALKVAYDEAYQTAYESISGQYALWDSVADVAAMSVQDVTGAMQSQTEYWANYDKNLQTLLLYAPQIEGLSDMIAANADGSADSVNLIAGMAESLNEGDITAVKDMVLSWQELEQQKKETADSLAELGTGIDEKTQGIIQQFKKDVGELDLSEEAKQNGMDTIMAYIEGAEGLLPDVASAFRNVSYAARNALLGEPHYGYFNPVVPRAYASGTYSADSGLALVGEAGPEFVFLRGGERILTAEETQEVLNATYPVAPQMAMVGVGAPAIAGRGAVQLRATIDVPLYVDGREFACATAEYMGEEMEFGGM